jgi:predicted phage tail component-like protein
VDIYKVLFNGNDISQVGGVDLYNHEFNALPTRDIKINKVARRDLSIITSSEYTQKEITVIMDVCSGSRADTESTLTFLKSLLQPQNAPLIVSQGGTDVEYTATMNEFNIQWFGATAVVEIKFIASDPIGRESVTQSMATITGITTSTSALSMTINGSATAYPLISITINSVTGGTAAQITISNGRTNQGIRIDRNWIAGDLMVIDSQSLTVTVNGVLTDFTGMFPQFPAGSQQIKYVDSFTTRNVDLTATYKPRIV